MHRAEAMSDVIKELSADSAGSYTGLDTLLEHLKGFLAIDCSYSIWRCPRPTRVLAARVPWR